MNEHIQWGPKIKTYGEAAAHEPDTSLESLEHLFNLRIQSSQLLGRHTGDIEMCRNAVIKERKRLR